MSDFNGINETCVICYRQGSLLPNSLDCPMVAVCMNLGVNGVLCQKVPDVDLLVLAIPTM